MREWILLDRNPAGLETLSLPPPVRRILANRSFAAREPVERFFNPSLEQLHSPFLFPEMDKAVHRILGAGKAGERILVYGDYDTDGLTATAILVLVLRSLGLGADHYIPHRMKEGYGLSMAGVEHARDQGFSLLIGVDCGTTAVEEVAAAQAAGIDVIICDHHEPAEPRPRPFAFFNPKLDGSGYPFKELSGAGVVFKLSQALFSALGMPERAFEYLDLCALGTVVDVSPLVDENRILVKFGLEELSRTKRPGLAGLIKVARIEGKSLAPYHLSFMLGPRLNAGGRMGHAGLALQLLLTNDRAEAQAAAAALNQENQRRQKVEEAMVNEGIALVKASGLDRQRVIVLAKEGWHEGVIGIAAARIAEKFYRPTLLVAIRAGRGKGSGRSVPGFPLADALRACAGHLQSFGGHKQAVGFAIVPEALGAFDRAVNEYAAGLPENLLVAKTYIDTNLSLAEVDDGLIECLGRFEPTGVENPTPTFLGRDLEVVGYPRVVGTDHLKFALREQNVVLPAIGFGMADRIVDLKVGRSRIDAVFSVEKDARGGDKTILKIKDMREGTGGVA